MKDPTLAPVKRYNWRANSIWTLISPGINLLWSALHIEETTFKKSSLLKLYFCFFWFTTFPSFVNVFFIHCISSTIESVFPSEERQTGTYTVYFFSIRFGDLSFGNLFKSTEKFLRTRLSCSHSWFSALVESADSRVRIPANECLHHFMAWRQAARNSFVMLKSIFWVCCEAREKSVLLSVILYVLNLLKPKVQSLLM